MSEWWELARSGGSPCTPSCLCMCSGWGWTFIHVSMGGQDIFHGSPVDCLDGMDIHGQW